MKTMEKHLEEQEVLGHRLEGTVLEPIGKMILSGVKFAKDNGLRSPGEVDKVEDGEKARAAGELALALKDYSTEEIGNCLAAAMSLCDVVNSALPLLFKCMITGELRGLGSGFDHVA